MATLIARPEIELKVVFVVSEQEARALDGLVGYGFDEFVKVFYEKLGKAYLEEHEQGLRTFFDSIRQIMPGYLSRANEARDVFNGEKIAAFPTKAR